MKEIYKQARELILSSKNEAFLYLTATLGAALSYTLLCKVMGLGWNPDPYAAFKTTPVKGFLAFMPGTILTVWFAAGLNGRFAAGALKSAPQSMTYYAKGWFFRKLTAELLFTCIIWPPAVLLMFIPVISPVLAMGWLIFAAWFSLRAALWFNASVTRNMGLIEALRISFEMTPGKAPFLLLLAVIPIGSAYLLSWLVSKVFPVQFGMQLYSKAIFDGIAAVLMMGVFFVCFADFGGRRHAAAA